MFISQLSGIQYQSWVKPKRVVVERRDKRYVNDEGKISFGWEVVRELLVGPDEVGGELWSKEDMVNREIAALGRDEDTILRGRDVDG